MINGRSNSVNKRQCMKNEKLVDILSDLFLNNKDNADTHKILPSELKVDINQDQNENKWNSQINNLPELKEKISSMQT